MIYTADHLDDARAVFLFRPEAPLDYHHRDDARQRLLLRSAFAGLNPVVDRWLGAYVLAGELERGGGDHVAAFAAYERVMADPVRHSRAFARTVAKTLVPRSELGVWALVNAGRTLSALPGGLTRAIARLNNKGVRLYDAMGYPDYPLGASAID